MIVEPTKEESYEELNEVSLQVADVGVQVSDDSQATIVRLSQSISNLEEQLMPAWKVFQRIMTRFYFTQAFQITLP